ncbi:hypothetical protein [Massilia sp. PWRC2]|uniref:hypothetical protein n=1 Tax=Massilia sp. PWRC2 TaxID=2804626 RepID=UPI003CE6E4DA
MTPLTLRPMGTLAHEWLVNVLPPGRKFGLPSLDAYTYSWVPAANYVVAGSPCTGAASLILTLAENFATHGGHVIWIGITEDLARMCEQLTFKIAGLDLADAGARVQLDVFAHIKLAYAREQIGKMWIDFCNVEDCGDTDVEREFIASVSSFKPTLIVVDESIFDEVTLNPFEVLVRQTHARRMVEELRGTNPTSSVLWHLPMRDGVASSITMQRPSLDDLPDAVSIIKPEVVLFTNRDSGSNNAELIVATNAYGTTGTVPMNFDAKRSTWREIDIAA